MDERLEKSELNTKPWVTISGLMKNNEDFTFNVSKLDQFRKEFRNMFLQE